MADDEHSGLAVALARGDGRHLVGEGDGILEALQRGGVGSTQKADVERILRVRARALISDEYVARRVDERGGRHAARERLGDGIPALVQQLSQAE